MLAAIILAGSLAPATADVARGLDHARHRKAALAGSTEVQCKDCHSQARNGLLGATPNGLIIGRNGGSWKVVRDDLPPWATSAVVKDGRLILLGNEGGRLRALIVSL